MGLRGVILLLGGTTTELNQKPTAELVLKQGGGNEVETDPILL